MDFSFPEKNKGYPWGRVVLTPSTARLGVQDARATEDQGSDGAFVTGSLKTKLIILFSVTHMYHTEKRSVQKCAQTSLMTATAKRN